MIDATDSAVRKGIINTSEDLSDIVGTGYMEKNSPLMPVGSTSARGKDRFSSVFLACVIASLASLNFGYTLGYTSPTQTELQDSHRSFSVTKDEFSLFGAFIAVGAIIGSIVGGYSVDKFGRKTTIICTSLLYTPGWCLISYADTVSMLYAGRILTGVAVGMSSLAVPVYIAEIASARLRGGLGSVNQLAVTIGIFLAYLVGFSLSWQWTAMVPVFLIVLMVCAMFFMPETPRWLLANNQRHTAIKELEWLRGPDYDVEEECFEIESNLDQQERVSFKDFRTPGLYRPLIIGAMMMVFQQFCGINAVLFYDAKIFSTAGFKDAEGVSLAVGGTQVIATGVACLLVDKSGRRILLIIGGIVMFACTLLLGIYYDIAKLPKDTDEKQISIFGSWSHSVALSNISWLAVLCVLVYIIVFSLGWGPLPWLLMSEIFPPRARGLASGIVTLINWSFVFVVTYSFDSMTRTFYEQGTFWFFSGFSLLSFLFVLFFVPETKGKTLEEIEQIFMKSGMRIKKSVS
ncbi:solute carrier family 2, facilitated glucose transporter member 8-like [Hydractinia symbiolongicarpus]|uniref:solute carrier family 2, facilitated glucose transporter member 8-like n=1 Tax=Hydractinia symbiolongicarpus TaxID=13093 RepID=UPI00254B11DB|nr:solute carrier family 2, facilitated glucose transporter member 8-like [Hydractinia symbiolongicarpus]